MKLHVRWDGSDSEQPDAAYGGLVWEHEGACFPHAGHRDFVADVLAQWSVAMRELLRGAEAVTLAYVEDGHALDVSRVAGDRCVVMLRGVAPPVAWPADVRELATMVCEAAAHVAARVPDAAALAQDAVTLRRALDARGASA